MYEPQRLTGTSVPLAMPVAPTHSRAPELDPVGMWYAFLATFNRRRKLFFAVFFGIVGAVALVTLLTPKRYTVDAKMIAGNPNSVAQNPQAQTALPVLNALLLANAAQSAETYAELITEAPVLQRAIRVKPVTNANIISISVTWRDPQTAAKIANDVAAVFVTREADLVAGQANGAMDFLSKQIPVYQRRMRDAEMAVSKFETAHHIADLDTETQSEVNAAAGIQAKINATQLDRQQALAQVATLTAQLRSIKPATNNGQS